MTVVEPGDRVEDGEFTVVRPSETVETTSLSALAADRPVLVTFYTADASPDCVAEWGAFCDFGWFVGNPRLQVVGVSQSAASVHRQFLDYLDLGFPLVADTDLALADTFGVTDRAFDVSRRSRWACFLVDERLEVRSRWLDDDGLDPTEAIPPVGEIHEDLQAILGPPGGDFGPITAPEV